MLGLLKESVVSMSLLNSYFTAGELALTLGSWVKCSVVLTRSRAVLEQS